MSFVGFGGGGVGFGVGFGFGNVGWIPLAPYERFHPWYGRGWWGGGRSLVVNNINIVHNANITNMYRNARVVNGVTAVSAGDFQRGNFRNRVTVDRSELQRGSLVRGAVPLTPSADNLRFSNRAAAAVGGRSDMMSQRFFSRSSVSSTAAQRTPFVQQQSAVRSAFASRGFQTSPAQGSSERFNSFNNSERSAPMQRTNPSPRFDAAPRGNSAPGGNIAPRGNPGWERFGNSSPGGSSSGASRSLQVAPPIVRQREASPSFNRNDRTFGAPGSGYRSAPEQRYGGAPAPGFPLRACTQLSQRACTQLPQCPGPELSQRAGTQLPQRAGPELSQRTGTELPQRSCTECAWRWRRRWSL